LKSCVARGACLKFTNLWGAHCTAAPWHNAEWKTPSTTPAPSNAPTSSSAPLPFKCPYVLKCPFTLQVPLRPQVPLRHPKGMISVPHRISVPHQVTVPHQISVPHQVTVPHRISVPRQDPVLCWTSMPHQIQRAANRRDAPCGCQTHLTFRTRTYPRKLHAPNPCWCVRGTSVCCA